MVSRKAFASSEHNLIGDGDDIGRPPPPRSAAISPTIRLDAPLRSGLVLPLIAVSRRSELLPLLGRRARSAARLSPAESARERRDRAIARTVDEHVDRAVAQLAHRLGVE
jgi:hypothetical protein